MKETYTEIMEIDAIRWGFINLIFGVIACLVQLPIYIIKKDYGLLFSVLFSLTYIPATFVFGVIQASVINFCAQHLGKGPILVTKTLVRSPDGEFKREIWER